MEKQIRAIEKIRLSARNASLFVIFMSVVGAALYFYTQHSGVLIVVVVGMLFLITQSAKKIAQFRYAFKDFDLRAPFENVLHQQVRVEWAGVELHRVEDAHVIPFANQFESENSVSFTLDRLHVLCSDVMTQYKYSLDGRNAKVQNLFCGQYIIISHLDHAGSSISIKDRNIEGTNLEDFYKGEERTEELVIDEKFSQLYLVLANEDERNQVMKFVPYLTKLKTMHPGMIYLGVRNDEVHIAIEQEHVGKDVSIYQSIQEENYRARLDEIAQLVQFITTLN